MLIFQVFFCLFVFYLACYFFILYFIFLFFLYFYIYILFYISFIFPFFFFLDFVFPFLDVTFPFSTTKSNVSVSYFVQLNCGKRGTKTNASSFISTKAHNFSDVSHISNINLSGVSETACSSAMSSRLDPPPDELENLDISSFQAPEDLLDGCRVCLTICVLKWSVLLCGSKLH